MWRSTEASRSATSRSASGPARTSWSAAARFITPRAAWRRTLLPSGPPRQAAKAYSMAGAEPALRLPPRLQAPEHFQRRHRMRVEITCLAVNPADDVIFVNNDRSACHHAVRFVVDAVGTARLVFREVTQQRELQSELFLELACRRVRID